MSKSSGKPHGRRAAASRANAVLVVDGSEATSSIGSVPDPTRTTPRTQAVPMGDYPLIRLFFGGTGTNNEYFNYRVIAWHIIPFIDDGVPPLWMPHVLAKGVATLGATGITSVTGGLFVDTITETVKAAGSIVIPTTPDDTVACLILDTRNAQIVTIETDRVNNDSSYVWAVPGEVAAGMTDIEVAGTGLSTAANQASLLSYISPTVSTGLASVITSDAEWTSITLTANAVVADVRLEGDSAYMVCQTATPADADTGCSYPPNIVYRIPCRGRTKIWIRRVSTTNVRIRVTDFSSA